MSSYKQVKFWRKEAGGQLFATFEENVIKVIEATYTKKADKRGRFFFWPNRKDEQVEIHRKYTEAGIHFVGDWHTHPEHIPRPSDSDIKSVAEMLRDSRHNLPGVFLVVVGTDGFPGGLYVGFHTRDKLTQLLPEPLE